VVRQVLASTRFFIAIAAVGMFLASVSLLVFGTIAVARTTIDAIREGHIDDKVVKHLSVEYISLADVYLLGTVLYIVALGLYELFVDPDLPMPDWLRIETLDDLKHRLIGVIIVLLGVSFVGFVVEWDGDKDIVYLGISIALVIGALGFILAFAMDHDSHGSAGDTSRRISASPQLAEHPAGGHEDDVPDTPPDTT
jgi:uncharacterized membrane protein YqhA